MLLCVSIAHSFASLNNISQCDAIGVCSSIHLHVNIWFVSSLSLVKTKAAANIHAQVHLWTCIFISFELTLGLGILAMVLTIEENAKLFPKVIMPIYNPPPRV